MSLDVPLVIIEVLMTSLGRLLVSRVLLFILPVCILSKDAALVLVDPTLSLDLLLLLNGAVGSGL